VKGAGTDPVVPFTAFAAPAEQLVAEVERAKAAAPAAARHASASVSMSTVWGSSSASP
jgi:hypothetical protein